MPSSSCCSFGHNPHGINIQNMRGLIQTPAAADPNIPLLPGGFRTDCTWKREVEQSRKDGELRGQLTSRLCDANKAAQAKAEEHLADGVGRVDAALRAKLGQVHLQAAAQREVLNNVNSELEKLSRAQQRINSMQAHLQEKLAVNRSRQQVRQNRPMRERTCDEVNRSLARQEALLGNLLLKLQRGSNLVDVDTSKLQDVRHRLSSSLKDKLSALKVDEAVLGLLTAPLTSAPTAAAAGSEGQDGVLTAVRPPTPKPLPSPLQHSTSGFGIDTGSGSGARLQGVASGSSTPDMLRAATLGAAKSACGGLYPGRWHKLASELLTEAGQLVADSSRLRKAVKELLQECLSASQAACSAVNVALSSKMATTGELRGQLASQLQQVQADIQVATQQQDALKESLQAKELPMQQLEARMALRSTRPATETVEDEVQAALEAAATQLKAVSNQLHARMDATGHQITHLNSVSAALLQHITDKDAALSLEEKVALMDGRKVAAVPPSPTVLSVASSSVSSMYSALGDSASQVGAPASHVGAPANRGSSRLGKAPASCAGSTTSSAMVRIAALEKELAAAKSESAELHAMMGESKQAVTGGPAVGSKVATAAASKAATPAASKVAAPAASKVATQAACPPSC